jgi:hypothetical protein
MLLISVEVVSPAIQEVVVTYLVDLILSFAQRLDRWEEKQLYLKISESMIEFRWGITHDSFSQLDYTRSSFASNVVQSLQLRLGTLGAE